MLCIYIYIGFGGEGGLRRKRKPKECDCVFDETEIAKNAGERKLVTQASLSLSLCVLAQTFQSFSLPRLRAPSVGAEGVQPYLIGFTSTVHVDHAGAS